MLSQKLLGTYHPQLVLHSQKRFRELRPRWDNLHQGYQERIQEANQDLDDHHYKEKKMLT